MIEKIRPHPRLSFTEELREVEENLLIQPALLQRYQEVALNSNRDDATKKQQQIIVDATIELQEIHIAHTSAPGRIAEVNKRIAQLEKRRAQLVNRVSIDKLARLAEQIKNAEEDV